MMQDPLYDNVDFIRENVRRKDRLTQLAEECCELSHAALKLLRVLHLAGTPTPLPAHVAERQFYEEVADVLVCLLAEGSIYAVAAPSYVGDIADKKAERWVQRIKEKKAADD